MDTFFERMSVRLTGSDKLDIPVVYVQFFHFTDIGGEDGPQICCTLFLQLLHFISFKIYINIYIYTFQRNDIIIKKFRVCNQPNWSYSLLRVNQSHSLAMNIYSILWEPEAVKGLDFVHLLVLILEPFRNK